MSRSFSPRSSKIIDLSSRERPGRRQLIEELFDRHVGVLRLFLRGWLISPEETEDVVQEIFTRLMGMDKLEERLPESTQRMRSYLLTMTNNLIVDRKRKSQVRNAFVAAQMGIEAEQLDELSPERIVAAQLELEAIRSVILDMPLNWRVALLLQRFRNMSYEEIALHMGVEVKQVDNYLVRALRRLRRARRKIETAGGRLC